MKLEFDKAISDYDTALGLAPDNSLLYRFRGDVYVAKREFALGIADFDVALSFNSRDELPFAAGATHFFSVGTLMQRLPTSMLQLSLAPIAPWPAMDAA